MNATELKVNWNDTIGKLKQEFDMFSDNDLLLLEIKQNKSSGRFKAQLNKTEEDVQNLISE